MKTFYIPTSTLNFNNILSSESISPKAFYEKRGFGYSRWATIPENPYNNAIVLYDKLCFFDRPKSDIEDHSLVVEVLLEESELKQAEGFWFSDHTIYLAPTTTRFLFFSGTDKNITLSMSENSSETKLIRLYLKRIELIEKPTEAYKQISASEPCTLNESEINKDFIINKLKGLLHGYYIGSLLSTDLDSVKYMNALKEVHNIFAAILSSFERQPTQHQNERLDVLFKAINRKSTDYQRLFEIIEDEDKTDKVLALDFVRPRDIVRKTDYLYYLQQEQKDVERENPAIKWIKERIRNAKNDIKENSQLLSPDKSEIVVLGNNVSVLRNKNVIDETEKNLCLAWFNKTLSSEETNGKISTYRADLADKITDEAIEVLGNNWKESGIRTYLNALRHHIAGEEFNQEWNNGLLSSIAAVVVAGDDWEKLLTFMQSKEMTDYSLAFAFYGELNGYANLLRDFTDLLYNQESKYVWEVYKEFYGQLIGERITEIVESDRGKEEHKPVAIQQTMLHENAVEAFPEAMAIKGHAKYSEKKHGKFIEQIIAQRITDWDRIKKMSKSKDWVAIINELSKSVEKIGQPNLFDEVDLHPIGQFFYCDKNVWYHIEPLVNNPKAQKDMKKDLGWFQDVFAKPKGQRGYNYNQIDARDNAIVIDKFYSLKKGKTSYESFRETVRDKLKDMYHVR